MEELERVRSEFHLKEWRLREAIDYMKSWILLELI